MVRVASLFAQVLSLVNRNEFARAVKEHGAEKSAKGFRCWDQFVAMLFCQLAGANSLREICGGLATALGKLKHLGLRDAPARSTLSYANEHRPWELYRTVFNQLLAQCQELAHSRHKRFRFKNPLRSLDSTVTDLCAEIYDWAKYRRGKGAIKLHLQLDHQGYLPCWALVTEGAKHDIHAARLLHFERGTIVVMDRAYIDFSLFARWTREGVLFVTRAKRNISYDLVDRRRVPRRGPVRRDETIWLAGRDVEYPGFLRRILVWDQENERELVLLTNIQHLAASTVGAVYRERWQIELFFKALKQNLKIKSFVGTSENAVKVQIWTALIAMLLLKYLQLKSSWDWSLSNLAAMLRLNLLTYRDLWAWLDAPFDVPVVESRYQQLGLFGQDVGQQLAT